MILDDAPAPPVGPVTPAPPVGPVAPLVPAYPETTMLAVVQLNVVLVAVATSVTVAVAVYRINPALGAAVIVVDQPLGAVYAPLAHVYVDEPEMLGVDNPH